MTLSWRETGTTCHSHEIAAASVTKMDEIKRLILFDKPCHLDENCMNEAFNMECSSEMHQSEMDDLNRKGYALNSILHELFEEKVSTQKNHHWILGPEDLNDTLVHDFEREEA